MIITPPEWVEKVGTEDFVTRLTENLEHRLRIRKNDLRKKFKISIRKGKTLKITVRPAEDMKASDSDGDNVDAEASTTLEAIISQELSEAMEEVLEEISHGI